MLVGERVFSYGTGLSSKPRMRPVAIWVPRPCFVAAARRSGASEAQRLRMQLCCTGNGMSLGSNATFDPEEEMQDGAEDQVQEVAVGVVGDSFGEGVEDEADRSVDVALEGDPALAADEAGEEEGTAAAAAAALGVVEEGGESTDIPALSTENETQGEEETPVEDGQQGEKDSEEVAEREPWPFQIGDIVVGRVKWTADHGCKVIINNTKIEGWCPDRQLPYAAADASKFHPTQSIDSGLTREFQVIGLPSESDSKKKGPLLSARTIDKAVVFDRMDQIRTVCEQELEVVTAKCLRINAGGVRCTVCGYPAFLPRSQCNRSSSRYMEDEEFRTKYEGKEIEVSIITVDEEKNRVVVSEKKAREHNGLRIVRPGSLVWGRVRSMREWGVFVELDNTRLSSLLHISNISQVNVPSIEDVFAMGDRVCAVVISMEADFRRISLSTADLERTAGDMLVDKEMVYMNAEQAVADIQREMDEYNREHSQEG